VSAVAVATSLAMAIALLSSAVGKFAKPAPAQRFVSAVLRTNSKAISAVVTYISVVAEMVLGTALIANPNGLRATTLVLVAILLTVYGSVILIAVTAGVRTGCGCHGLVGERPSIRAAIWRGAVGVASVTIAAQIGFRPLHVESYMGLELALFMLYVAASGVFIGLMAVNQRRVLVRYWQITSDSLENIRARRTARS